MTSHGTNTWLLEGADGFCVIDPGQDDAAHVAAIMAASGGKVHIAQHAIQMQTIISLVSVAMGIALVPESLRHLARSGVRYVELAGEAPQLETGIVWRRGDGNPTLGNFLRMVADGFEA